MLLNLWRQRVWHPIACTLGLACSVIVFLYANHRGALVLRENFLVYADRLINRTGCAMGDAVSAARMLNHALVIHDKASTRQFRIFAAAVTNRFPHAVATGYHGAIPDQKNLHTVNPPLLRTSTSTVRAGNLLVTPPKIRSIAVPRLDHSAGGGMTNPSYLLGRRKGGLS